MSGHGDAAACAERVGGGTTENVQPAPDPGQADPDEADDAAADHVDIAAVDDAAAPGDAAGETETAGPLSLGSLL